MTGQVPGRSSWGTKSRSCLRTVASVSTLGCTINRRRHGPWPWATAHLQMPHTRAGQRVSPCVHWRVVRSTTRPPLVSLGDATGGWILGLAALKSSRITGMQLSGQHSTPCCDLTPIANCPLILARGVVTESFMSWRRGIHGGGGTGRHVRGKIREFSYPV